MPARAVILNADDLGLGSTVDRGIFEAWQRRAIGDSTVFANAPDLPALLQAAGAVGLPVGIHLNLTAGRPLSPPEEIPALVSATGLFVKRQEWALPLPEAQVRRELTAQVQRVLATGWIPTHLDSHHHVHLYPGVLETVIALAGAFSPPLPVRALDEEMRAAFHAAGIPTPDVFSMRFYGEQATVDTLIAATEACAGGVLEIMTHPGYDGPALISSYRHEREQELAALTDPRWHAYLSDAGIPIVGFAAVKSPQ